MLFSFQFYQKFRVYSRKELREVRWLPTLSTFRAFAAYRDGFCALSNIDTSFCSLIKWEIVKWFSPSSGLLFCWGRSRSSTQHTYSINRQFQIPEPNSFVRKITTKFPQFCNWKFAPRQNVNKKSLSDVWWRGINNESLIAVVCWVSRLVYTETWEDENKRCF